MPVHDDQNHSGYDKREQEEIGDSQARSVIVLALTRNEEEPEEMNGPEDSSQQWRTNIVEGCDAAAKPVQCDQACENQDDPSFSFGFRWRDEPRKVKKRV